MSLSGKSVVGSDTLQQVERNFTWNFSVNQEQNREISPHRQVRRYLPGSAKDIEASGIHFIGYPPMTLPDLIIPYLDPVGEE